MSPDSMVVEDGIDEAGSETRSRSGWVLVGVGFAFGLALGIIAASPLDTAITGDTVEETPIGENPEPPSEFDSGISVVIPEFPDALVAVSYGPGSGLEHVLWPLRGPVVVRPMTHGLDVRFDTSGDYFAMSTRIPDLGGVMLSVGRSSDVRAVEAGVTSYAWHDSERGHLAYTTEDDDGWRLLRVTPRFAPGVVPTAEYPGGSVVAWGDWGYAIQTSEDQLVLLTASGELKDRETGRAAASHRSGWVLVEDGGFKLVSAGGGVRLLGVSKLPGPLFSAAFSPDGGRLAAGGTFGLIVYDLDHQSSETLPDIRARQVAWSSDSRFVIAPSQRGVLIYDLETEELHRVLVGRSTVAAAPAPLSNS